MKKFFISAMLFFCFAAITACGGKSNSTTETAATEEKHEDEHENTRLNCWKCVVMLASILGMVSAFQA